MRGFERFIVLWALLYLVIYVPFSLLADKIIPEERLMAVIFPLTLLGFAQNLAALILTIRDLYKRSFPHANQKLTWLLLIQWTGGIGWIVYIFKYGLKPREPGKSFELPM